MGDNNRSATAAERDAHSSQQGSHAGRAGGGRRPGARRRPGGRRRRPAPRPARGHAAAGSHHPAVCRSDERVFGFNSLTSRRCDGSVVFMEFEYYRLLNSGTDWTENHIVHVITWKWPARSRFRAAASYLERLQLAFESSRTQARSRSLGLLAALSMPTGLHRVQTTPTVRPRSRCWKRQTLGKF